MELSSFAESNAVLGKPDGYTDAQCEAASVFLGVRSDNIPIVVTCWKPTQAELDEIQRTGRVWCIVHGLTMPPVELSGFSPFAEAADDDET